MPTTTLTATHTDAHASTAVNATTVRDLVAELRDVIAVLADTSTARRAVAAVVDAIGGALGDRRVTSDPRDVPLVVRQREFVAASRRLTAADTVPTPLLAHLAIAAPLLSVQTR